MALFYYEVSGNRVAYAKGTVIFLEYDERMERAVHADLNKFIMSGGVYVGFFAKFEDHIDSLLSSWRYRARLVVKDGRSSPPRV